MTVAKLRSSSDDFFFKSITAKNTKTMALVLSDAVINTSGLFQDLHENVTDLVSKGIQAEKFFGNNLKLTSDIRDSYKLHDINANVAARECRSPRLSHFG